MPNLKQQTPKSSLPSTGVLFGADSTSVDSPSTYALTAVTQGISVKSYGAVGDAQFADGNATISSGSNQLTFSSGSFSSSDIGKTIYIPGAGAAGATLITTIEGRTSSTVVTLAANAGTALSAVSTRISWGTDDTTAIQNACAASANIYFPPGYYLINVPQVQRGAMVLFSNKAGVKLIGDNAWIVDGKAATADLTNVFDFEDCSEIEIDLNYTGLLVDPLAAYGLGPSFIWIGKNCSDVKIKAKTYGARYSVLVGDYSEYVHNNSTNINVDVDSETTYYMLATYGADNIKARLKGKNNHRWAYIAGCYGGVFDVYGDGHYAPYGVLFTDALVAAETSKGCQGLKVNVYSTGRYLGLLTAAYAAGISFSRPDPTIWIDNEFKISIYAKSDAGKSGQGFFGLTGTEQFNVGTRIDNLKISGKIDRSQESVAPYYEMFVRGYTTANFTATSSAGVLTIYGNAGNDSTTGAFVSEGATITGAGITGSVQIGARQSGAKYGAGTYLLAGTGTASLSAGTARTGSGDISVVSGQAQIVLPTNFTVGGAVSTVDDAYKGQVFTIAGNDYVVKSYTGSTKTAYLYKNSGGANPAAGTGVSFSLTNYPTVLATSNMTMDNIVFEDINYTKGSYTNFNIGAEISLPSLQNIARINSCDFGTELPFMFQTNLTSLTTFLGSIVKGTTNTSSGGAPTEAFASNIAFIDTNVGSPANLLTTNKSLIQSKIRGSGSFIRTKIIDSPTLSGASVTLTGAIPAASIVFGINGNITEDITGATGYLLGTAGSTQLYANRTATAKNTKFSALGASSATTPLNYPTATDLIITAKTSNFTAGKIRIAIYYISFTDFDNEP